MQHIIEDHVKVYLIFNSDAGKWEVDSCTNDGYPLFGLDEGPEAVCNCDDESDPLLNACKLEAGRVWNEVRRPNSTELLHLLADSLGYQVIPRD